jgi:hypothetical protein
MAKKKGPPNKAKTTKPKRTRPSEHAKIRKSLAPVQQEFEKVLNSNDPAYRLC